MSKQLFLVICKGMTDISGSQCAGGRAYVVAVDVGKAYQKLRSYLDEKDLGFTHQRELESVTLLAEESEYPDCGIKLFL